MEYKNKTQEAQMSLQKQLQTAKKVRAFGSLVLFR